MVFFEAIIVVLRTRPFIISAAGGTVAVSAINKAILAFWRPVLLF